MKALIIGNSKVRLENATEILKKYCFSEQKHINNYYEALNFCFRQKKIDEFDLIILDLSFNLCRPSIGKIDSPNSNAGFMFLSKMYDYGSKKPVIIYSIEEDYARKFNEFLFPSFAEYKKTFDGTPELFTSEHIEEEYEKDLEHNHSVVSFVDFILGQAQNDFELDRLVLDFVSSK